MAINTKYYSFTQALVKNKVEYIWVNPRESFLTNCGKRSFGSIVTIGLFIAAFLETILRLALFILAKSIHFFIPKDKSDAFDEYFFDHMAKSAGTSSYTTIFLGYMSAANAVLTPTINRKVGGFLENHIIGEKEGLFRKNGPIYFHIKD